MHWLRQQQLAEITGQPIADGTAAPITPAATNKALAAKLAGLETAVGLVPDMLAPMPPTLLELPAGTTLYAKATAGTWDVEVLSFYKA